MCQLVSYRATGRWILLFSSMIRYTWTHCYTGLIVIQSVKIQNQVLYTHCHIYIYVTAIKGSLPTNSPTVTSWICCDRDCIDSGRNHCDKCDGENCDMYPRWQFIGVWQASTGLSTLCHEIVCHHCVWHSLRGTVCVKETLKPPISLLKPIECQDTEREGLQIMKAIVHIIGG